jgi:hypothetical protein
VLSTSSRSVALKESKVEIVKTQITVKAFGKEFLISKPTARKTAEFKQNLEGEKNEVEMVDIACKFLNQCGLPEEVTAELEIEHLHSLIETISAKKK